MEETMKRCGHTAGIEPDPDPANPRKEFDNLCTMVCDHRQYKLGDGTPLQILGYEAVDFMSRFSYMTHDYPQDRFASLVERYVRMKFGAVCFTWLGMYDHSGITIYPSSHDHSGWDSGVVGFAYVDGDSFWKDFGEDTPENRERAYGAMISEITTYDQYVRGDVWGYVIREDETGKIVDSCSGFYGREYVEQEVETVLDSFKPDPSTVRADKVDLFGRKMQEAHCAIEEAMKFLPMGSTIAEALQEAANIVVRNHEDVDELDFEEDQ